MQSKNAHAIVNYLEGIGEEASVDEYYSGRGMFGEKTAAVIADDVAVVFKAMGKLDIEDSGRTDSMGLGVVVY